MAIGLGPSRDIGGAKGGDNALQAASLALNNGRPKDAERIAGEMLKADPRHTQALRILGYALLMQGRPQDAVAVLEPAARGCRDAEIDTQLAIALRQVDRREDALAQLKRAIKRRPPFGAAFHEFGCLLLSLDRCDEAIDVLSRGLEVAPMMPELSTQLGTVFLQCRNFANARAAFARALQISPNFSEALYGMAMVLQQVGEYQAAAKYYRHCLTIKPDDTAIWLNLGHCLLELGEHDAGYECFRTAARGDPKRYGSALASLVKSGCGQFWLKPSAAAQFLRGTKS